MKSVLITYNKALHDNVMEALDRSMCRGFTAVPEVTGRGSRTGEPHLGSHAWPTMNSAVIAICPDERVDHLLDRLRRIDVENPRLGLRAFVWTIDQSI